LNDFNTKGLKLDDTMVCINLMPVHHLHRDRYFLELEGLYM